MEYTVEVKEILPQPTAAIRATTTEDAIGTTLAEILPEVWHYLAAIGVKPIGPPFTRYLSSRGGQVELEGGLPVAGPVPARGRVQPAELPGGRVAVTWHVGPYDNLREAYESLATWIQQQGLKPAGPPWENYWTDPGKVPNPAEWRTEVICPVK